MFPWCSLFLKVPRGLNAFSDVKFLLCERKAGKAGTADCYEAKKTYIVDDVKWRHKARRLTELKKRSVELRSISTDHLFDEHCLSLPSQTAKMLTLGQSNEFVGTR